MASVHGNPLITKVLGISAIVLLAVLVVVIAGAAINQQQFLKSARLSGTAQAPASTGWMSDGNDPARNAVFKSNPGSRKRGSKRVVRAEGSDDSLMNVSPRIKPSVTSQYHARYKDPSITATAAAPHRRLAAANVPYQQQQLHLHQQQQQQHQQKPVAHHRRPMQPRLPPQRPQQAAAHDSQHHRQQHYHQQQQQAPTMASTVADAQFDLNLEESSSSSSLPSSNQQQQQQQLEPQNKLAPKRLLRGFGASVAPLKSKPKLVGAPQTHQAQSSHRRNEVLIM